MQNDIHRSDVIKNKCFWPSILPPKVLLCCSTTLAQVSEGITDLRESRGRAQRRATKMGEVTLQAEVTSLRWEQSAAQGLKGKNVEMKKRRKKRKQGAEKSR